MSDLFVTHDVDLGGLAAATSVAATDITLIKHSGVHKSATPALMLAASALTHAGAAAAATLGIIVDSVTAAGASTTVTLTGSAVRANANFFVLIQDQAALGTLIAPSAQTASSFTFTSTNTHVYSYIIIGL